MGGGVLWFVMWIGGGGGVEDAEALIGRGAFIRSLQGAACGLVGDQKGVRW